MKNHPVIVGLKAMADGVFAFGWFAAAARFAMMIADATGWLAALYFALFAGAATYGGWCVYELGKKTLKNKKG